MLRVVEVSSKWSIQGGPQILKSEAEMLSEGRKQTDLAKLLPGRSVESVKQKCQYRLMFIFQAPWRKYIIK